MLIATDKQNEFSGAPGEDLLTELGQVAFDLMRLEARRDQIKAELRYREALQKAGTLGLTEDDLLLMLEIFPELTRPGTKG